MSRVDYLRQERLRPASVLLQFLLVYKPRVRDIYIFCEGRDDISFYRPIVAHKWNGGTVHAFRCKGKSGVIAQYKSIRDKARYIRRSLFFVDRDLDHEVDKVSADRRLPRSRHFFETSGYSIENYLVNVQTLRCIWLDLCGQQTDDPRLRQITATFQRAQTTFQAKMQTLMAWTLTCLNHGESGNLEKLKLDEIVIFDSTYQPIVRHRCEALEKAGLTNGNFRRHEVRSVLASFAAKGGAIPVRGKLELWFLVKFWNKIVEPMTRRGVPNRVKIQSSLSYSNAIDMLAPRVPTPPDLASFLDESLSRI